MSVSRVLLELVGQSQLLLPGRIWLCDERSSVRGELRHSAALSRKANQPVQYRGPAAILRADVFLETQYRLRVKVGIHDISGVSRISARGVLKVRPHTKSGGGGGGGGGHSASGPIPFRGGYRILC